MGLRGIKHLEMREKIDERYKKELKREYGKGELVQRELGVEYYEEKWALLKKTLPEIDTTFFYKTSGIGIARESNTFLKIEYLNDQWHIFEGGRLIVIAGRTMGNVPPTKKSLTTSNSITHLNSLVEEINRTQRDLERVKTNLEKAFDYLTSHKKL